MHMFPQEEPSWGLALCGCVEKRNGLCWRFTYRVCVCVCVCVCVRAQGGVVRGRHGTRGLASTTHINVTSVNLPFSWEIFSFLRGLLDLRLSSGPKSLSLLEASSNESEGVLSDPEKPGASPVYPPPSTSTFLRN